MSAGAGGGREPYNPGKLGEVFIVTIVWILIIFGLVGLCGWLTGQDFDDRPKQEQR